MIVLVTSKPFPTAVILRWFSFLFISLFLGNSVDGTDIQKDDAATAESNDEIIGRYADRIRAYVNITYTDPVTGKQKSEKSLKGKWGTNGRMEQVAAPAHIAVYGNKTDGCKKIDQPVPTGQWIAIIERGQCRFSEKIRNAIDANASAVIIYDNEPGKMPLFMHHDVENAVAIFITKEFGDRIVELIENDTKVLVRITIGLEPATYPRINRTSVLFVSISFIVLMIISLAWLIFYYIQRFRYAHAKDRLAKRLSQAAKKAITKIPIRTLKPTDKEVDSETDACAICIDSFLVGEVVRVLPCQHIFHKSCVDPWLLEQRTCPMCKLDILKAYGLQVCPSQDSLSRGGGRTSRPNNILAGSEEGLGFDSTRDDDLMNGFSSEPSSVFRSSPRIVHIATSISAAGRLANAPPPPRNNNLTSRIESFSRPQNMVCPRHGVSIGSCSHGAVDLTTPESEDHPESSPAKESVVVVASADFRGSGGAEVVLDHVEELSGEISDLGRNSPSALCKCSLDDHPNAAEHQLDDFDDDDVAVNGRRRRNSADFASAVDQALGGTDIGREEGRPKSSGLLSKEVYLSPSLPGALDEETDEIPAAAASTAATAASPPTPPPTHPLTPETLIASRTARGSNNIEVNNSVHSDRRLGDICGTSTASSPTPSPPSAHRHEARPQSALSNVSCSETTQLTSHNENAFF